MNSTATLSGIIVLVTRQWTSFSGWFGFSGAARFHFGDALFLSDAPHIRVGASLDSPGPCIGRTP
jgi:hypothetical protein